MTFGERLAERAWYGRDRRARALRVTLAPLGAAFEGIAALRGSLFEVGALRSYALALPSISVGNLTVGGTGKTPVAAWVAARLLERGARPAIVLRGYGGDEPLVHRVLNPAAIVVADRDRVAAVALAASQGATMAVLDDAFQHRRARRDVDLVLVSADRWDGSTRALPAGPWREPLSALRRATITLVTRKAVDADYAEEVQRAVREAAPAVPTAIARLEPEALRDEAGQARPLDLLHGRRVLAISAIGDPRAFERQLTSLGAHVEPATYGDHHAFTAADAASLARIADRADVAVCTLKDAVKLWPLWPRGSAPLWYVSQRLTVESGAAELDASLDRLIRNGGA